MITPIIRATKISQEKRATIIPKRSRATRIAEIPTPQYTMKPLLTGLVRICWIIHIMVAITNPMTSLLQSQDKSPANTLIKISTANAINAYPKIFFTSFIFFILVFVCYIYISFKVKFYLTLQCKYI